MLYLLYASPIFLFLFPRATDGILHLTMVLHEADSLPHFIQVVDDSGRLSNSLPVHMDSPRCRCGRGRGCGCVAVAAPLT